MQNTGPSPSFQLDDEIAAGKALQQLLRKEQEQLIGADIDGVGAVTEEKARLIAVMGELAQARHRALQAAGYEAGEAGMQQWVRQVGGDIADSWNALLEVARDCKELNRVNGLLIGQHMARNQAALNVLQGGRQSSGGALYGPDGQATSAAGGRRLVVG